MTALHGWIILDKPLGLGSTQGVSAVKRSLRTGGYAKVKIGHGGTLDPLATGVLPIALGEATKLAGRMLDSDKVYDFTITFGTQTDGLDAEGQVIATSDVRPTRAQVEAMLPRFTGPIDQVPPAFSAIKIDGKRAYDRARAGEDVAVPVRAVVVSRLSVWAEPVEALPFQSCDPKKDSPSTSSGQTDPLDSITLTAHVSKGTYIRSLARDIALACGTVGHVTMLRRTKAGPFTLAPAISLDFLDDAAKGRSLEDVILPLTAGLDDIPALAVSAAEGSALRQGRELDRIGAANGLHFAQDGSTPVALVEITNGIVRVVRGFNF